MNLRVDLPIDPPDLRLMGNVRLIPAEGAEQVLWAGRRRGWSAESSLFTAAVAFLGACSVRERGEASKLRFATHSGRRRRPADYIAQERWIAVTRRRPRG
jgi:hypothetical protein